MRGRLTATLLGLTAPIGRKPMPPVPTTNSRMPRADSARRPAAWAEALVVVVVPGEHDLGRAS